MNIILIYIFIVGLCIGSFLNVCIGRICLGESILWPPSHCDRCGYRLKFIDLIPVLSYIFLKGRCRKCKSKISIQYPIIELINALLYLCIYYKYGFSFYLMKYCLLVSFMLLIAVIDIKTKTVYSKISIFGIVSALMLDTYGCIILHEDIFKYISGALITFILFYIIVKVTGAMGDGDIDAAVVCSLFLGIKYAILTILLSFILGGVIGILLLYFKQKKRNDAIAFLPYLALGSYVTVFLGDILIKWYLKCC